MTPQELAAGIGGFTGLDGLTPRQLRTDPRSGGLMKQYFSEPARAYAAENGDLADNVYEADCQGLDPADFYAWHKVLLRSANTEFTGYTNARPDDTQRIYILRPETAVYLPAGAMLKYAGSTWLVTRSRNLAVPRGSALLRRCSAMAQCEVWETPEGAEKPVCRTAEVPLVLETPELSSAAPYTAGTDVLAAGQLKGICQRCPVTEAWDENTRLRLGRGSFYLRGLNDFTRELTDDPDSCRLLSFTLFRCQS